MIRITIFIFYCTLFIACQKTIHYDVRSVEPQLVIEGYISNNSYVSVNISTTTDYYNDNSFPTVSNAIVIIKNKKSTRQDTLKEVNKGEYVLNKRGSPGETYQLFVTIDTTTYTAESTMPYLVNLDSITFAKRTLFDLNSINAVLHFQDPPDTNNYYLFKEYLYKNRLGKIFSLSDRLSDGRYLNYTLSNDSAYISPRDSVLLSMSCISKSAYNYFSVLESISNADNGFGSASPANPPNNFTPNVLGIFSAQTNYSRKVFVPEYVPNE